MNKIDNFKASYNQHLASANNLKKYEDDKSHNILIIDKNNNILCKKNNFINNIIYKISGSSIKLEDAKETLRSNVNELNKEFEKSINSNIEKLSKRTVLITEESFASDFQKYMGLYPSIHKIDQALGKNSTFASKFNQKLIELNNVKNIIPEIKDPNGACAKFNADTLKSGDWDGETKELMATGMQAFYQFEQLSETEKNTIGNAEEIGNIKQKFLDKSFEVITKRITSLTDSAVQKINEGDYEGAKEYMEKREEAFSYFKNWKALSKENPSHIENATKKTDDAIENRRKEFTKGKEKAEKEVTILTNTSSTNEQEIVRLTDKISSQTSTIDKTAKKINESILKHSDLVGNKEQDFEQNINETAKIRNDIERITEQMQAKQQEWVDLENTDFDKAIATAYLPNNNSNMMQTVHHMLDADPKVVEAVSLRNGIQKLIKIPDTVKRDLARVNKTIEEADKETVKAIEYYLSNAEDRSEKDQKIEDLKQFVQGNPLLKGKDITELEEQDLQNLVDKKMEKTLAITENAAVNKNLFGRKKTVQKGQQTNLTAVIEFQKQIDEKKEILQDVKAIAKAKKRFNDFMATKKEEVRAKLDELNKERADLYEQAGKSTASLKEEIVQKRQLLYTYRKAKSTKQEVDELKIVLDKFKSELNKKTDVRQDLSQRISAEEKKKLEFTEKLNKLNEFFPNS